ncbi:MAG: DUF366 family protein [Bacillota bacterium]|jgi:hypothetical protein
MQFLVHKQVLEYDGSQLSSLWALRGFNLQGDSIVTFRGPCRVDLDALVDIRDRLDRAPIYSPDMLHFIVEHFDLDLEKTVCRQRLLMVIVKDLVGEMTGVSLRRLGDDLWAGNRKLSVSIATLTPVSTMIHAGLNVDTTGVPVPAVGLGELGLDEDSIWSLAQRTSYGYADEMRSCILARCKVRGVP